ncbi:MAG: hemerythrin, partial [Anaerolineae bacterium]|nr:hemerythrin [Anaerolineae bacterium]
NQHNQLTAEVESLYADFKLGKKTLSINLLDFLKEWLRQHILESDKKLGDFLIQNGVKPL